MNTNASKRPALEGVRLLIVDDDEAIRTALKRILQNAGCIVIDAGTPSAAIEAVRAFSETLDLALVDILLPEMSGPECAERLLEEQPGMAVGYMSGYLDMTPTTEIDVNDTNRPVLRIEKPFRSEELVNAIRAALVNRTLDRFPGQTAQRAAS